MASADCKDSISKLSSPRLRCWSIHVSFGSINDSVYWTSCLDRHGFHGFHCSEYFRCLLYNPVALPNTFPPSFSTPTTCLWGFVFVGSGVQVKSGCWGSIGASLVVSSDGGAPGTFCISRSFIDGVLMAIRVHLLSSIYDGSGWRKPAGGRIPLGNSPSFIDIGGYCW